VLALGRHSRSEAVARAGCGIICSFAYYNSANRDKLKAAGVHTVIDSVMKDHTGNQEILKRAQEASAEFPF
jgi:hypothetical protein